jgi:signal recognition particle receptor subunit beta
MVFFNYATMQMAAKIVYYGPGLCGKTTNLHVIYSRTAPNSRGEMVSLETETDRTLFFDLLPLDVGVIGGFKTRLQLYTVPGQVFYNTTRKLVLKGVDGIVFVADSQRPMLDSNRESLKNLRENLLEIGLKLDEVPRVLQFNKRDLQNVLTIDEMNQALNPERAIEWYEASATNSVGVFETLKAISKLTLKALRAKMTGDVKRPAVVATPATPAATPRLGKEPARPAPPPPAAPAARPPTPPTGTMARLDTFSANAKDAKETRDERAAAPGRPAAPPPPPPLEAAKAPEAVPEISFGETHAPPPAPEVVESAVKHVRVRSNVDILSELDKLRKLSTQKPAGAALKEGARAKSGTSISIDDLLSSRLNHKRDVSKSFEVGLPKDALSRSRQLTIALRFADDAGVSLGPERTLDVELASLQDIQKLLLSLKINVQGE